MPLSNIEEGRFQARYLELKEMEAHWDAEECRDQVRSCRKDIDALVEEYKDAREVVDGYRIANRVTAEQLFQPKKPTPGASKLSM